MSSSLVGQTLLEQFRVDAFVAAGGMGAVYRVWDTQRNVPLAMKVLHADLAEDPSIFKRFEREARALQKLAHPNIVPFYGLYQTLDIAFLMERYVDGPTLKQILRKQRGKPLPIVDTLTYLKTLASALGYAHSHGVVHCDVKPGNVMVDRGGSIYLTDFGVARHAESTTTTLGFAGTAAYISPEQCRAEPVSAATDVYAMGVMLFEMLTGKRPFRGDERETEQAGPTASERVRYAHLHVPPPDPRTFNPHLSAEMAEVVLKALAKDPKMRFHTVRGFFLAACRAAGLEEGLVPDRMALSDAVVAKPTVSAEAIGPTPTPQSDIGPVMSAPGLPTKTVILGGLGLLVVIVAIFIFGSKRGGLDREFPQPLDQRTAIAAEATSTLGAWDQTTIEPPVVETIVVETTPEVIIITATPPPTLAPTPTAVPARWTSPPRGKIVYSCYVNIPYDEICIMNADGSGQKRLTYDDAEDFYASLAPDGRSIVFSSRRDNRYEIYSMDIDGSDQTRLTHKVGSGLYAPAISPDGRYIVFANDKDGTQSIWVMDRDGDDPHALTDLEGEDVDPIWSPDGSQIAFTSNRSGGRQIFIMDADGSNMHQLTSLSNMGGRITWSPDGRTIGFYAGETGDRNIYLIDIDGSDLRQLTHSGDSLAPCFSPDGEWITFASYRDGDLEVYIMRPDGSEVTQLTYNDTSDWQPRWGP